MECSAKVKEFGLGVLGYEFVKRPHLCLECCSCIGNDIYVQNGVHVCGNYISVQIFRG